MGLFDSFSPKKALYDPIGLFDDHDEQGAIDRAARIQSDALKKSQKYFKPYYKAGLGALEQEQASATPEGMNEMLMQIFGGEAFGGLRDERMSDVKGMLGAGGLLRSGEAMEAAADIPSDLGLMLEQILSGRNNQLVRTGERAAFNLADLFTRSAEATASGILGVAESDVRQQSEKFNLAGDVGSSILGGMFSDPSLKKNIHQVDTIGPLGVYKWDWIPETKGTIVENMPTHGFMSTEVGEHYPQFVGEFGGYDIINYTGLLAELEHATG